MKRRHFAWAMAIGGCALGTRRAVGQNIAPREPARPTRSVDIPRDDRTAPGTAVPAGADLQKALNAARPGDRLLLAPGATYVGPFTLPLKSGDKWITLTSDAVEKGSLSPGQRVSPTAANMMPKLVSQSGSVIESRGGAHHYRLVGIEIRPATTTFLYNLVLLGNRAGSPENLPHHIVFDRCYVHGDPKAGTRRGIALNGTDLAVVDSHVADIKEWGADSQAVGGWSGPGPFKIANNYLEAAGENVMFGGADPDLRDVVPSDIEIRDNHIAKPLTWRVGDPSYAGTPWTVKNLLELKNARRVLIEGNLFEYSWAHAQSGTAIVFTGRNQNNTAPWSVVEDVTFTNNVIRHVGGELIILGRDDIHPNQLSKRFLIKNNVFDDVSSVNWGGNGWLFSIYRGPADVVIENNTGFSNQAIIAADGEPAPTFVFRNNIVGFGVYGIFGANVGNGLPAINHYFPSSIVECNVMVGADANAASRSYPRRNFFAATMAQVGFVAPGGYRLSERSPYRGVGCDGKDPGADPRSR